MPVFIWGLGRIVKGINLEMWWLIGSAPDFWGRGPGFESGMILMRCRIIVIKQKISGERGKPTPEAKKDFKKYIYIYIYIIVENLVPLSL